MSGERLYESAAVWDQQLQLGQRNLITAICDHWPDGVRTVLDVGCGDGKITHALAKCTGADFHGFDGSREALSRLRVPSTLGDVRQLPFGDQAFDLVMTTDVFEHLPDEVEQDAWHELFRVARDWVFFAVPFREELLDATARCQACGAHYHVNWHQRSYDFPDLTRRAPAGWKVSGVVLSGEPWSPMLPPETAYRRMELDEWSGWSEAVCPECGASGQAAEPAKALPQDVARALGLYVYDRASTTRFVRSHSEILVAFNRTGRPLVLHGAGAFEREDRSAASWAAGQGFADSLDPYPQVAKVVPAVDGGFVAQFPVYPGVQRRMRFVSGAAPIESLPISIEDGEGRLFLAEVSMSIDGTLEIELPREPKAGYYGLLVRLPASQPFASITLAGAPTISWVRPVEGRCGYFPIAGASTSVQVTQQLWLDEQAVNPAISKRLGGCEVAVVRAITESERQRDHLGEQLAACALQLDALARERRQDAEQFDRLQSELSAMLMRYDELQARSDEIQARCEELQARSDEFQTRREVRAGQWVRSRLGLRDKSKGT